jgi:uncharacterized membrane protein required for colicin V production
MGGMPIDIIDVLFIVMASFGFYFGYTFGLLKLALLLFSFLFATLAAMAFTPMTTAIIVETFEVDSIFLPFIAFGITLIVVLMLARIVTKLLEETLSSERVDVLSRSVGGVLMAIWFSLLYSVLVIFFGKAGVFPMVFNEQVMLHPRDGAVRLGIPPKNTPIGTDTLYMKYSTDQNLYRFGNNSTQNNVDVSLGLGFVPVGNNNYSAYISKRGQSWDILESDTVTVWGTRQLILQKDQQMICFCDSKFRVHLESGELFFDCLDKELAAKSPTSRFYLYIEQIPKHGKQLIAGFRPFIDRFVKYMGWAVDRLQQEEESPVIKTNSEENNKTTVQPIIEEDQLPEPIIEEPDTFIYSIDTTQMPVVNPSMQDTIKVEPEEEDAVNYEG